MGGKASSLGLWELDQRFVVDKSDDAITCAEQPRCRVEMCEGRLLAVHRLPPEFAGVLAYNVFARELL